MNVYHSVAELIGNTPLLEVRQFAKKRGLRATILVKLEGMNPAGSAKDRVALEMILRAEAEGKLRPGSVIIEPTSGNTGIGLASVARARGYRVILTMPDSMSLRRGAGAHARGAGNAGRGGKGRSARRRNSRQLRARPVHEPAQP